MSKLKFKEFRGGPYNSLIIVIGALLALALIAYGTGLTKSTKSLSYSQFIKDVEAHRIKSIKIDGNQGFGAIDDEKQSRYEVTLPEEKKVLLQKLQAYNVDTLFTAPSIFNFTFLLFLISVLTGLGILFVLFRSTRGGGGNSGNIFGVGKSKARLFMPSQIKVNFNSVAGAQEAKEELKDVVDFLKNPEKYKKMGAKLTKGVLLVGEPGNGKTLLARAVAGEAHCPFFSISGSDFIEVFVGVGASRVRDLFAQARKSAPCIVFIDEIDAVGRQRGVGAGGGHDEREQTLNQLLTEMDGFDTAHSSVVVIAATNRPDVLDKALLRPGRFDRRVTVPYPDLKSREQILQVHLQSVPVADDVDVHKIARASVGMTGADLANLINEASIAASKNNQDKVTMHDFENARDKLALGIENKSWVIDRKELENTAYHESGHALINLLFPKTSDPLHKITIMPRGRALGVTWSIPEKDKFSKTFSELETQILILLGGRAAEELIFGDVTTGAYNDFQKASQIVRSMICAYGMSERLGTVDYTSDYQFSPDTGRMIDDEVRNKMKTLYDRTMSLLKEHRDKLEILAKTLLEKETIYAEEVYTLLSIEPRVSHKLA